MAASSLTRQPLIVALHQLVHDRTPQQALEHKGGAEIPDIPALQTARDYGNRVLHVVAALEDEVMMPAVRAFMLFRALADCGELIGSVPSQEGVELFTGREIQVWLASEDDEESVARAARGVSDVRSVTVA